MPDAGRERRMQPNRRNLLTLLAASVSAGVLPRPSRAQAKADLYDIGKTGNVRLLHMTDTHANCCRCIFASQA